MMEGDAAGDAQATTEPGRRHGDVHPAWEDVGQLVQRQRGLAREHALPLGPQPHGDAARVRPVRRAATPRASPATLPSRTPFAVGPSAASSPTSPT